MEITQGTGESKVESIELILARLLRVGAILAALLIGAGLVALVLGAAPALAPTLITYGLLVLVATPVMRVAVAMIVFLWERDMLFALFCLVVLVALAIGIVIGKVE